METRVHPCLQRISQVEVRFRRPDGADRCIVSVHDESLPRKKWRMGVVHELIKGVNKKTKGAVVRITDKGKSSYLRRPVQPLFPLVESAF